MKQMFNNTRLARFASVLGIAGMLAGIVAVAPANAQNDGHFNRWNGNDHGRNGNDHGRYDRAMVARDERRLHDLYDQRRDAKNRHDWRAVKRLDQRITDVRSKLDHDKHVTHH